MITIRYGFSREEGLIVEGVMNEVMYLGDVHGHVSVHSV